MNRQPVSPLTAKGLDIAERHLGIEEPSRRLGVSETTIRAWRFGHVAMPDAKFLKLVDVLVTLDPDRWSETLGEYSTAATRKLRSIDAALLKLLLSAPRNQNFRKLNEDRIGHEGCPIHPRGDVVHADAYPAGELAVAHKRCRLADDALLIFFLF
jgi:hypothetical protein